MHKSSTANPLLKSGRNILIAGVLVLPKFFSLAHRAFFRSLQIAHHTPYVLQGYKARIRHHLYFELSRVLILIERFTTVKPQTTLE